MGKVPTTEPDNLSDAATGRKNTCKLSSWCLPVAHTHTRTLNNNNKKEFPPASRSSGRRHASFLYLFPSHDLAFSLIFHCPPTLLLSHSRELGGKTGLRP